MTFIRKLASALCWAICFSSVSNAQVDTSGNLINNQNWSGITYGVDPNDCCSSISGSGPLYDTSTDTIMFSFGQGTVGQTIGINQALGSSGIQVHGYNYRWDFRYISNNTTKNDSLYFTVETRNSAGAIVESQVYNYDAIMNSSILPYDTWISSSDSYTFNSPYLDPQSIKLTITGRDGGFWAGYYGPEVRNVSLSVNYSFDPCAADPLYSSSCPGYWEAWFQQFCLFWCPTSSEPEIDVATVDYTLMPSTTTTTSMPQETTTGEVKIDAGGIELSTTGELQVPDGIPEEARQKKPVDMNLISKIVRDATDESATMAIVNRSIEQSMDEYANPDFSMTNETLASIDKQRDASILENQEINNILNNNLNTQQSVQSEQSAIYEVQSESTNETSELQNQSLPRVTNEEQKEITQTVKKEVENNDAAGDVGIDDIAKEPLNFDSYLNKQLADMQFYQTEDIYKNLEPVDNRRALRLMNGASDRLHQEMVNEQYK